MACKKQALIIFLLSLFTFSSSRPDNGGIAIYWGQNNGDGDLRTTCDTDNYKIVIISFLTVFGGFRPIHWNLAGHCDNGAYKNCTELEPEIKHCQEKGIQVFLSLGGDSSDYYLNSLGDAKNLSSQIYDKFLSGQYGPFGSVTLDGIDFAMQQTGDWDDLARELDFKRRTTGPYFYLSASPQCPTPIYYLDKAIATKLFNYIFVEFYNNPCGGNPKSLLDSWDIWVNLVAHNNSLFVGLPASPNAGKGYLEPKTLIDEVLPHVKESNKYEGVCLWDRSHDAENDYSGQILPYVFKSALPSSVSSVSHVIYQCVSKALNRILPTRGIVI